MSILKALLVTVLLLSLNPAIAKVISLHCTGEGQGTNIQGTDYEPVDIQVHVSSGRIFGFPAYQAPGCGSVPIEKAKIESKVTENWYQTYCKNSMATSSIQLNRYSGNLTMTTFFLKENASWYGRYMCTEQKKKF